MRLPPLSALRVFHEVGKCTSMRRAAAELNVTHTAVVRHMRELESWFGTKLVETTPGGTVLNAQGRRLHDLTQQGFELIAQATAEIRPPGQSSELRIWAAPGFATFWILPRLSQLQREMPRVAISLLPTEQTPSFGKGEADVEVRYGPRADENLISIEIVRPRVQVLASANWIAAHPEVQTAADLAKVPLVHERLHDDWRFWFEQAGVPVGTLSGPRVGVLPAVLEAVRRDQGPGLFPEPFIDEHILRGNLRPAVPEAPRLRPYVMVVHRDRIDDPAIRAFQRWLKSTLQDF
ncbi:LysR family transcriptional regulator [Mesorhizobium sp. CO1-1-8]|nr:LysR family transcriptional regulator [Mesorhizobium sp. CO1-1-8]